jgi:hypothetical protein
MKPLAIPQALSAEFATVQAVWGCGGATRRVDALLLSWAKYEKQLRRLFCFLVFQHPKITEKTVDDMVAVLADNNRLYADTFERAIETLKVAPLAELVGDSYETLKGEMRRIKSYRNKLMHGQITGKKITALEIERDVHFLIQWISTLANGAQVKFGYDGIGRNTYRAAKANGEVAVEEFPFQSAAEFKEWLRALAK